MKYNKLTTSTKEKEYVERKGMSSGYVLVTFKKNLIRRT